MTSGPAASSSIASQLPVASDPAFAQKIRQLEATLPDPLADFNEVLRDLQIEKDTRFAALYGMLHRYRREGKFEEYRDLANQHEAEFGEEAYFDTFRVILSTTGSVGRHSFDEALEAARRAVKNLKGQASVLHQHAELSASKMEFEDKRDRTLLREAVRNVNEAIRLSSGTNAQYYATRARLEIVADDTEAARVDVGTAIARENAGSRDFARRVSRYESIRSLILIHERQQKFLRAEREIRRELESFRAQQLQLLGLLAAIIAFISTAATLAAKADVPTGFRLFIVAGGVISIVFSALASALGSQRLRRAIPGVVLGAALIATGYLLTVPQ